jgi:multiple sugar transport system substrate-binding protein
MKKAALFCTVAVIVVIMCLLFAVEATATSKEEVAEEKEFNIWVFSGQEAAKYGEALDRIMAEFESTHPGYTVKLSTTPYPQYLDRIITAVRGGEGPDLIQNDVTWSPVLAYQGLIINLDDYWAKAPFKESDFFEASIKTCKWQGSFYSVPQMDGHWGLIYYNKDLVEEAGYDPENPFTYWDEFVELAKAMTKPEEGQYGYGVMGARDEGSTVSWAGFFATTGARSWLSGDLKKALVNSPGGVAAAKFKTDLALVHNVSPPGVANWTQWDSRSLFSTGKLGMYMSGSWERDILREEAPDIDFSFTYLPRPRDGVVSADYGGWNWSINVNSEMPDIAWDFIEMVTTNENLEAISSLPPALVEATEKRFAKWDKGQVVVDQISNALTRPVHPFYTEISDAIQSALQSILLGEKDAQEAMDDAAAEINEILGRL